MKNFSGLFRHSFFFRQSCFKGACIALFIIFIFLFSLGLIDRVVFRPKSIFARGVRNFEKQNSQIQILFLGQSDMQFGIIPDEFNYKAFNFAGSGENFIETYYKLKHYIYNMPELKIVVLPITFPSFSSYRADEIQWEYFSYGYITYNDILELFKLKGPLVIREKLLSFCPIVRRIEMIDFLRNIKKLLTNQPLDKTEMFNGYVKHVGSNVTMDGALERVKRQFKGQYLLDNNFLLYFEKILNLCSDNNIKVFVVTLPVSNYYLEHSNKYIKKDLLYEKVLNNPLYSKYIHKYLDLLDIFVKDQDLFLNQDHLNDKGARKVSRLIASEWSDAIDKIMNAR